MTLSGKYRPCRLNFIVLNIACYTPHITVATAETHYVLPDCAYIYCLVSINVQQVLKNVNGCNFFYIDEFNDTQLFRTHFYVMLFCQSDTQLLSVTRQK